MKFHYFDGTINGLMIDPHNDHLPFGLIAQLLEHCISITGVSEFFMLFFRYWSISAAKLRVSLTLKLLPSAVKMNFHQFEHQVEN